jgi:hypothetical protein
MHGVVRQRIIDLCQWVWEKYRHGREPNDEPRVGGERLPQAVGTAAPPYPGGGGRRGIQKDRLATVARVAPDKDVNAGRVEVWFGDEADTQALAFRDQQPVDHRLQLVEAL